MYFNLLEDQGETLEGVEVTNVRVFPVATGATIMAELPLFAFYDASMAVTVGPNTFPDGLYFAHILIFTSATGPTASIGAGGNSMGRRLLSGDDSAVAMRKLLQGIVLLAAPPCLFCFRPCKVSNDGMRRQGPQTPTL